jgi:endonuclease/exonuclease/phosphatase family metal-dependent hydrolase
MLPTLRVATFNIHKGLTSFNARLALHDQREVIRNLQADVVFLQEVQDEHHGNGLRFKHWPTNGQTHFLAEACGPNYAYGKNAVYPGGHHGNAVLSRFPILQSTTHDISAHEIEQRGLLHCEIAIDGWSQSLHCICVHLGLLARWRFKQFGALRDYIHAVIPEDAPLVIAGDFNDWRLSAGHQVMDALNMREVFEHAHGKPARSFPSMFPLFRLDRIYVRGFHIHSAHVHGGPRTALTSDHAALSAVLEKR